MLPKHTDRDLYYERPNTQQSVNANQALAEAGLQAILGFRADPIEFSTNIYDLIPSPVQQYFSTVDPTNPSGTGSGGASEPSLPTSGEVQPGGITGSVQYNAGDGIFAGESYFTFDPEGGADSGFIVNLQFANSDDGGGGISLIAGGGDQIGDGGNANFYAGNGGSTSGLGGDVTIQGGSCAPGQSPGDVVLITGQDSNLVSGLFRLKDGATDNEAELLTSSLTDVRSFTFPDQSGTFALTNTLSLYSPTILATTTAIDGKTTGTTNLYTVPAGKTAIITQAIVRTTTATAVATPPDAGLGIASGEDDIFASSTLFGLTSSARMYVFTSQGGAVQATTGQIIKLGIDTGATGTTLTLAVDLIGYLV